MLYIPSPGRYENMQYNRCGKSGVLLPAISLSLSHNFGTIDIFEDGRKIIHHAFDNGITHFDLANNYGPAAGSAEENFGRILKQDFTGNLRDELIISTKAGYAMWEGPYGNWGSRKHLMTSCHHSLKRMGLEYVDIFYSHRPDPETPVEETMMALDHIVRSGKALYAGICNYDAEQAKQAINVLKSLGTPCLIHQSEYSMFMRWNETHLPEVLETNGVGRIASSSKGLLAHKNLKGIPAVAGNAKTTNFYIKKLNEIARKRNQSLAQMSLAWLLKDKKITSALINVNSKEQLNDNLSALNNLQFAEEELEAIEKVLD
jgi:L-glyceraldehyde 3-phosphate reductase